MATLRHWNASFGIDLVAHYDTMLNLLAKQVPPSLREALQLAWEHYFVAPDTFDIPGFSVREYARALLHTHRWFLHSRP